MRGIGVAACCSGRDFLAKTSPSSSLIARNKLSIDAVPLEQVSDRVGPDQARHYFDVTILAISKRSLYMCGPRLWLLV
jgi:hypothetical protein